MMSLTVKLLYIGFLSEFPRPQRFYSLNILVSFVSFLLGPLQYSPMCSFGVKSSAGGWKIPLLVPMLPFPLHLLGLKMTFCDIQWTLLLDYLSLILGTVWLGRAQLGWLEEPLSQCFSSPQWTVTWGENALLCHKEDTVFGLSLCLNFFKMHIFTQKILCNWVAVYTCSPLYIFQNPV